MVIGAVVIGGVQIYRNNFSTAATASWASGAGDDDHLNDADPSKFGAWRGEPLTYATIWTYPSGYTSHDQVALNLFTTRNYNGIINLSSGWPEGTTWASAANGGLDQYWTDMVDTIVEDMGPVRRVHLAFAYEFNGTWMNWSVNGDLTNFGKAWKRFYNIVQARKGNKDIKIVLPFSGGPQAGATIQQYVDAAGTSYFDILGVDMYDCWFADGNDGNLKTQTEWDNAYMAYTGSQGPRGWGAWAAYAKNLGKPISHPEWGMSDRRDVPVVDNPFWIQKVHEHFTKIAPSDPYNPGAGQLAGEAFFDTWDQSRLYPTTLLPNSAAAYRALTWGTGNTISPTATPTPSATPTATPTPTSSALISQTGNLVNGKTFVSSATDSTSEPGNPASNVNDMNEITRWISSPTNNTNLTTDLETTYTLNKVSILWAGDTVKNYLIQMSPDNITWNTISSGATNNTQKQLIETTSFSATPTGRYLRVVSLDRWNTSYGNSIWEIGAYGAASTLAGDITGDGRVNIFDLSILLGQWGSAASGDLNRDGTVNAFDLSLLLAHWTG